MEQAPADICLGHAPLPIEEVPLDSLEGVKFAFVDLDGTALNKQKIPSNGFWAAVEAYEATGGRVITATGNAREAAVLKVQNADASGVTCPADLGGDGLFSSGADLSRLPGVYQNGAEVRGEGGAEISATWLDGDVLLGLLDWFHNLSDEERAHVGIAFQSYGDVYILAGPSAVVEVPPPWTTARKLPNNATVLEKWSRAPFYWGEGWGQALNYIDLKQTLADSKVHCAMILCAAGDQQHWVDNALCSLGDLSSRCYHCIGLSDAPPLDRSAYTFTHPDATKGNGLKMLLEHFDSIDTHCAAAFGDNLNDLSMFLVDGVLGVAVRNAREELKAVAQAVTGSNEDPEVAGVARALNRLAEARRSQVSLRSRSQSLGLEDCLVYSALRAEA